jgi:hypothetical protein
MTKRVSEETLNTTLRANAREEWRVSGTDGYTEKVTRLGHWTIEAYAYVWCDDLEDLEEADWKFEEFERKCLQ